MKEAKSKYAWTAKVGEKGQIVIPKEARDVFNIKPGDTLLLLGAESMGVAIVKPEIFDDLFKVAIGLESDDEETE